MMDSDIKIDKDGIWYYRGAHMFRQEILAIFFDNLNIDDGGRYFIQLNEELCYLDVEDTVFVVTAVSKTKDGTNGSEQLKISTSDQANEILNPETLEVGENNVMYCRIRNGKFAARFTRKSYYQLAEFIEQDDTENIFYVNLNNQKYYIKNS